MIVDIEQLHQALSLTGEQRELLRDALEKLMRKYNKFHRRAFVKGGNHEKTMYFAGVVDGLNHAFKLISEVHDDYNEEE